MFQYVLNPTFTNQQIDLFAVESKLSRAYDGTTYLPGIVGLNNIKANDYCNVVLQVMYLTYLFFVCSQNIPFLTYLCMERFLLSLLPTRCELLHVTETLKQQEFWDIYDMDSIDLLEVSWYKYEKFFFQILDFFVFRHYLTFHL